MSEKISEYSGSASVGREGYPNMVDITLRPAQLTDARPLARLWAVTFADKFGPILGNNAEAVLGDWLRLSRRHLQTTTVADIEGAMAGFMVLEMAGAPRPDDGRWLWRALQLHNGLWGALRGLVLMTLVDHHHHARADEVYIEMLGVASVWRGQGVARRLVAYAEAVACQKNLLQLTLAVVNDNLPALCLYQKMGFVIQTEQRSHFLQWITGHPGYYDMVKRLG